MRRSNSNPTSSNLSKRRSFRGWLKRVTIPNGNGRRIEPDLPKGGVFGIPLSMSIKYAKTTVGYIDDDNIRHTKAGAIPIVVAKCGSFLKKNGLNTEGIFRVPGNARRVNTLELLFDQSTSNYGLDLVWDGYTVHDAASLLRRYLNKLPDPVIPFEFYREFRDVMNNNMYHANEDRIQAFQQLVQRLPIPHQHLLLYLLDTLSLFASNASETKMNISNLAAVFCPGILRHPDHNTPVQYKISQYVIEFLIEFQSLFTMQLLAKPLGRQSKKPSTQSMNNGIPPVPLLVSSTAHPTVSRPGPLRVTNPSSSTTTDSTSPLVLQQTSNQSSSFVESPTDVSPDQQLSTVLSRAIKPDSRSPQNSTDLLSKKATAPDNPYYRLIAEKIQSLRRVLQPYLAKPTTLLACFSILAVTLCVMCYEFYLAFNLYSLEPVFFFVGLASYWSLLYKCLPEKYPMPSPELDAMVIIPTQASNEPIEDDIFPDTIMNAADEEAMMKDEDIMSEWRDLLTRSWKTSESENSSGSKTSANKADDEASIMSKASRFDEEEDLSSSSASSSSDDEDLGFDPETLEMYLSQYDQIKKDAQLAKQLQIEEQRARDENNPFLVDRLDISKSKQHSESSLDYDNATTPTDPQKEEWKIRVFNR